MNHPRALNIQQWIAKAIRYCDTQERCGAEMERKLRQWGCDKEKTKDVLKQLIKNKHIDEQRYANSFAQGKFRMKKWGRLKIMAALHHANIPVNLIENALRQIDEDEYRQTLIDMLTKKWKLTSGHPGARFKKTATFAVGKGYEAPMVYEIIKTINIDNGNN
jgi:regulatory protein